MRRHWKLALATLSLAVAASLAGCAPGYYDGYADYGGPGGGYYDDGYYDYAGGGYCDAWGCPDGYYDMPLYYGSVYYGGSWFNGPHYYRDYGGRRQYWIHGGWHSDGWRGARPSWWREGRTGPALGRDFYRSERFRNSRNAGQRDNRGFTNRGGGDRGGAPQSRTAPQAQPQTGGRAFQNGRFLPRSGGSAGNRGGGGNRGDRGRSH